jgi:hypothetical protein
MLKGRKAIYDAREKYEEQKMINLNSKELCYEMDPFEWKLVKCADSKTKVEIIQENDPFKNWESERVNKKEEILKRIIIRDPCPNENNTEVDGEKESS